MCLVGAIPAVFMIWSRRFRGDGNREGGLPTFRIVMHYNTNTLMRLYVYMRAVERSALVLELVDRHG